MSYTALKLFILSSILFTFCMGIYAHNKFPPHEEIYPFFSWFLFYVTPSTQYDYTITIEKYGDEIFNPSLTLEQAGSKLSQYDSKVAYYLAIQKLGWGIEGVNGQKLPEARKQLEKFFLNPQVSYTLWKRKSNPIDLWKNGTSLEEIKIQQFNKGMYE